MEKKLVHTIVQAYDSLGCRRTLEPDAVQYCCHLFQDLFHALLSKDNMAIARYSTERLTQFGATIQDICEQYRYRTESAGYPIIHHIMTILWDEALDLCFSPLVGLGSHQLFLTVCYHDKWYELVGRRIDFYPISCPELIQQLVRQQFDNHNYNFQRVVADYICFVLSVFQTRGWEYLDKQIKDRNLARVQAPLRMMIVLADSILRDVRADYHRWSGGRTDFPDASFLQLLWTFRGLGQE